jgi:hypothetical protein
MTPFRRSGLARQEAVHGRLFVTPWILMEGAATLKR